MKKCMPVTIIFSAVIALACFEARAGDNTTAGLEGDGSVPAATSGLTAGTGSRDLTQAQNVIRGRVASVDASRHELAVRDNAGGSLKRFVVTDFLTLKDLSKDEEVSVLLAADGSIREIYRH